MQNVLNSIFNILNESFNNVYYYFTTHLVLLYCKLCGIKTGDKNIFYGKTAFRKKKESTIQIGSKCRFRSKQLSNLIGINHRCIIATHRPGAKIIIGDGCGFSGTVIGSFDSIILGNNVRCGANTVITDSDWHNDDPRVGQPKPIQIEDNVWLGYGVIVMKGVIIGKNSVIGAGSVVTKSIPANVIAAGNPCRVIKEINIEQ